MSIPAIIGVSLILGLIAGAGAGIEMILPVTVCTAVVLYVNRKKIAAQDTQPKTIDSQPAIALDANYYAWPASGKFAHTIAGEYYEHTLAQWLRENPAKLGDSATHKAYLIPENNNPYDSQAVKVVIEGQTIAQLSSDESRSLRHRLVENQLADQITTCDAKIVEDKSGQYEIHLDIEPLTFYELPWMAG